MPYLYLSCLLIAIFGLGIIDWRYRLAYFDDRRATLKAVGVGSLFFLIWDMIGIGLGIYFPGSSSQVTSWMIAPGLPIEEIFFLILLTYMVLIIHRLIGKKWPHI